VLVLLHLFSVFSGDPSPIWGPHSRTGTGSFHTNKSFACIAQTIVLWGRNMNLIGHSGICRSSRVVHALHDSRISMPLAARPPRVEYRRANAAAELVVAARQVEYIPTHVCEKGGRCGCCCLLRSIWNVGPAEAHSSSMTSRPIGCATSLSSEL
jgi:ferredoxin